jgi:hypothetical protein
MGKDDRHALIGQLFVLITAKFEDGAGLAIEGHRPEAKALSAVIQQLRQHASDILTLLDAVDVAHPKD